MELKNSKTYINLARAYCGESCARNRYDMLAKLAKQDGYTTLCDAIKTIAINEFNHARMLFSFIDSADCNVIDNINITAGFPFKAKIGTLEANLKHAADDENTEATKIYPAFAREAEEEGFKDIANFFTNLAKIETCHSKFFTIMYEQLKNKTMYKRDIAVKWKCMGCGHEDTLKQAWSICPVCQAPQGLVMLNIPTQD